MAVDRHLSAVASHERTLVVLNKHPVYIPTFPYYLNRLRVGFNRRGIPERIVWDDEEAREIWVYARVARVK